MMEKIRFDKTWAVLLGESIGNANYWVERGEIPIGTLKPFESYWDGVRYEIPECDIVKIPFSKVGIDHSLRDAFNILILGGSGDGKSLIVKNIWSHLHDAQWRTLYIDPVKTQSGNARRPWKSPRMPPHTTEKGIAIQHFVPRFAINPHDKTNHNFRKYAMRLNRINHRDMWEGLGMTAFAASKVAKIVKRYNDRGEDLTVQIIENEIDEMLKDEDISTGTAGSAKRVLNDMVDYGLLSDDLELDLLREWKDGYDVCISYKRGQRIFVTFDIGMQIKKCAQINDHEEGFPIMIIFDDSSYYAQEFSTIPLNFSVQEILEIGNNYRGNGIYNMMAVQSLGIIDADVAETYKYKIISPLFARPETLASINVPPKAIQYLRGGELVKDRDKHLMQFVMVDKDNNVVTFFPFTPKCNHFVDVYMKQQPREAEG